MDGTLVAVKTMWLEAERKATLQVLQETNEARMAIPAFLKKKATHFAIPICPYQADCADPNGYCCRWNAYQSEGDCKICGAGDCDCGADLARCAACET